MSLITMIHMIAGAALVMLFILRLFQLLIADPIPNKPISIFAKLARMLPHLLYTVIMITGLWQIHMIVSQTHQLPYWILIKIVLFIGAVAAYSILTRLPHQAARRRIGIVLGLICFSGILYLATKQPVGAFSFASAVTAIPADLHDSRDELKVDDSIIDLALDDQEPLPDNTSKLEGAEDTVHTTTDTAP